MKTIKELEYEIKPMELLSGDGLYIALASKHAHIEILKDVLGLIDNMVEVIPPHDLKMAWIDKEKLKTRIKG